VPASGRAREVPGPPGDLEGRVNAQAVPGAVLTTGYEGYEGSTHVTDVN
jgi:hypothetical protein